MLTVLPGTLPVDELPARLADTDAAVILKLGRTYPAVREALSSSRAARRGLLRGAGQHRRRNACCPPATSTRQRCPYFSLAMVPGPPAAAQTPRGHGRGVVVGLGPGDTDWMTPESRRELAARHRPRRLRPLHQPGPAARRPAPAPERQHRSRPARARLACTLAEQGRAVAVVSSGDPGVFAMAAAVLEEAKQWPDVPVRVLPGMTAAQAVASRVGAPLGHDYAVISLSDRLKPWDVVAERLTAAAQRRPGARDLQPGLEDPHLAGRRDARSAAGAPRPGHAGGHRPRRVGPARRGEGRRDSPTSTPPRSTCGAC